MAEDITNHVCGRCQAEFGTEQEYLDHVCPETGFAPTDPEHLGEDFKAISEEALKRGEERRGEEAHPADLAAEAAPPEA